MLFMNAEFGTGFFASECNGSRGCREELIVQLVMIQQGGLECRPQDGRRGIRQATSEALASMT